MKYLYSDKSTLETNMCKVQTGCLIEGTKLKCQEEIQSINRLRNLVKAGERTRC